VPTPVGINGGTTTVGVLVDVDVELVVVLVLVDVDSTTLVVDVVELVEVVAAAAVVVVDVDVAVITGRLVSTAEPGRVHPPVTTASSNTAPARGPTARERGRVTPNMMLVDHTRSAGSSLEHLLTGGDVAGSATLTRLTHCSGIVLNQIEDRVHVGRNIRRSTTRKDHHERFPEHPHRERLATVACTPQHSARCHRRPVGRRCRRSDHDRAGADQRRQRRL
jgi:hypothetical protein